MTRALLKLTATKSAGYGMLSIMRERPSGGCGFAIFAGGSILEVWPW
jgi:hypothetical protein